jgi:glycosyl transferase family 25
VKIFIISLHNSERRKSITSQMKRLNLSFEYFDAVNGKQLSSSEITEYCDSNAIKNNPRWLNRGAIGCALSHLFLYQKMIKENVEKAIVLEDDMLVNHDFLNIYNFLKDKRTTEEVIQLYYRALNEIKFSDVNSIPINSKFKIHEPYSLNDIPITTGCYYITKDACVKLVKVIKPIKVTADSWKYFILNSQFDNLKSIFPRPIQDAGFKSEIDYHENYSNQFEKKIKLTLDRLNFPLFNTILQAIRKKREKSMSIFTITDKPSILKLEKKALNNA